MQRFLQRLHSQRDLLLSNEKDDRNSVHDYFNQEQPLLGDNYVNITLRILTGEKHPQIKLQHLRKV